MNLCQREETHNTLTSSLVLIKTTAKMTTKPLLLLAALTFCCCIASMHAFVGRCHCIRTSSRTIPIQLIKKIEVHPISGHCRWTEIIVTKKKGSKVCVDPNAKWVNNLLTKLQSKNKKPESTAASASSA
ncbi:C-X-C motif chemokine 2 [Plectropomus leopardus]|uniref:C-X-C motif chemokine 2 n=1 Tax=Plectropomus leopardus TaxID=160734 RepID=UPI001C4DCF39|nr:C-X-C motif chemokine 2 [Plectropomus leopardus]